MQIVAARIPAITHFQLFQQEISPCQRLEAHCMLILKRCRQLIKKPLVVFLLTLAIVIDTASAVQASVLFERAEDALECLIKIGYGSTLEGAIANVPFFIFTMLDLLLFVATLASLAQIFMAFRQGEEIGHLLKIPASIVMIVALIVLFQQIFIPESCPAVK